MIPRTVKESSRSYEAADSGLLSPELAAGIRRVKGAKYVGVRLGNWLTAEQARALWQVPDYMRPHIQSMSSSLRRGPGTAV